MDDNMEDDIICEVFTVHLHLLWKVISITASNIDSMMLHKAVDGSKYKTPNYGSVLAIGFIIVICLLLQTRKNLLRNALQYCNQFFCQSIIVDCNFKNLVASSTIGSSSFTQELAEGIVGVYALQGRRGTMEDKYSVMQEVDVGGSNKLSLFGVYDGHGGQFVAEYVKQHLFLNTVKKIKELRASLKDKKGNPFKECNGKNKRAQKLNSNSQDKCEASSQDDTTKCNSEKECDTNSKVEENKEKKKEDNDIAKSSKDENNEKGDSKEVELILKKEDPYSNFNLKSRKKSCVPLVNENKETESKKDLTEDSSYIDINSNVNYSKLLNDQIMDIDEKIVNFCKSKTDLSGTTAVIAVLDGELLIIGNVGDSRAVMGDLKGATIPLSFDHKPNQLKERRRIKEAGGFITFTGVWRVAGILATSRALGDFPLKDPRKLITAEPDVLTFSLRDHKAHFVILATDGLWDVMSNEEAVEFVRIHIREWDNGARSLVQHAYEKGSQDNITAMIINISKLSL